MIKLLTWFFMVAFTMCIAKTYSTALEQGTFTKLGISHPKALSQVISNIAKFMFDYLASLTSKCANLQKETSQEKSSFEVTRYKQIGLAVETAKENKRRSVLIQIIAGF